MPDAPLKPQSNLNALPYARREANPIVWYWGDWLWWIPLTACALNLLAMVNDFAAGSRQGFIHLAWVEIVFMLGTIAVGIALVALVAARLTRRIRSRPMWFCIGVTVLWFILQFPQLEAIARSRWRS